MNEGKVRWKPWDEMVKEQHQKWLQRLARRIPLTQEQLDKDRKQREWEFAQYQKNKDKPDPIPGEIYSGACVLDYPITVIDDCFKNGCTGFYQHQDGTYRTGFWQRPDGTAVIELTQAHGLPFIMGAAHKGDAAILAKNPRAWMKASIKHQNDLAAAKGASTGYSYSPVKHSKEDGIVAALECKCFSMEQIANAGKVTHQYVRNLSKKRCAPDDHQANLDRSATTAAEELKDLASYFEKN